MTVGVRAATGRRFKGLINPFWIAVNMLLRAMGFMAIRPRLRSGRRSGPAHSDQLAAFALPSLICGRWKWSGRDRGSPSPAILGRTETAVSVSRNHQCQKPFRDWLTEVLNCAWASTPGSLDS